uniref:Uncharacterized protein n=1 Tax=Heterorhabditis bacteriophora TaxID=37862 RepID=A0A1I7XSZ0_HETBA
MSKCDDVNKWLARMLRAGSLTSIYRKWRRQWATRNTASELGGTQQTTKRHETDKGKPQDKGMMMLHEKNTK